MMHQRTNATVAFDADVHVLAVDGDPDRIAFYDGSSRQCWLSMDDPLDLRDYR